jgi:hypothetical protein
MMCEYRWVIEEPKLFQPIVIHPQRSNASPRWQQQLFQTITLEVDPCEVLVGNEVDLADLVVK